MDQEKLAAGANDVLSDMGMSAEAAIAHFDAMMLAGRDRAHREFAVLKEMGNGPGGPMALKNTLVEYGYAYRYLGSMLLNVMRHGFNQQAAADYIDAKVDEDVEAAHQGALDIERKRLAAERDAVAPEGWKEERTGWTRTRDGLCLSVNKGDPNHWGWDIFGAAGTADEDVMLGASEEFDYPTRNAAIENCEKQANDLLGSGYGRKEA